MKLLILIALTILGLSSGHLVRVARDASTSEHYPLETIVEKVKVVFDELETMASDAIGAADTEEMKQKAGEHIDKLSSQFSDFSSKIKEEADHLKDNEMVKDLKDTVDKHVQELKQHWNERVAKFKEDQPKTYDQIAGHIDSVKDASAAIVSKIDALTQSEEAVKLKETALKFMDDAKENFLEFLKELKVREEKKT